MGGHPHSRPSRLSVCLNGEGPGITNFLADSVFFFLLYHVFIVTGQELASSASYSINKI